MSLSCRFNRAARAELEEAISHYETRENGLGLRFASVVEEAIAQICAFPEIGPAVRGRIRKKALTTFPYSILFSVQTDGIRVLAVAHQRRQPLYWLGRS